MLDKIGRRTGSTDDGRGPCTLASPWPLDGLLPLAGPLPLDGLLPLLMAKAAHPARKFAEACRKAALPLALQRASFWVELIEVN